MKLTEGVGIPRLVEVLNASASTLFRRLHEVLVSLRLHSGLDGTRGDDDAEGRLNLVISATFCLLLSYSM